jgi:hypothetical protein
MLLSQEGLDITPLDEYGKSIAHHLCRHRDVANLRRLVEEYPDVVSLWHPSYQGVTPMDEVLSPPNGRFTAADDEIVDILLSHVQMPADAGLSLPSAQLTKENAESRGEPVPAVAQRLLKWGEEHGLDVRDYYIPPMPADYW